MRHEGRHRERKPLNTANIQLVNEEIAGNIEMCVRHKREKPPRCATFGNITAIKEYDFLCKTWPETKTGQDH